MDIIITGNITNDIDIRYFENGKVKSVFSVATNTYNPKTKEKDASFFNISAWEKQAEFIGEHFKKGDKITLECSYKHETYTSKTGEEKEKDTYTVRNIIYSGAYAVINGKITQEETRNKDDKFIQYAKLDNLTLINKNEKFAVEENKCYTVMGVLHYSEDIKLLCDVISVYQTSEDNDIVKFAENEITDEIPF